MVDTGTGERLARTIERARKFFGPSQVQAIVLTHRHYDHVGGAAEISAALNAPVLAHHLDAPPIREGSAQGTEALMFGCRMKGVEVRDLAGDEVLSTGDHNLNVIHTPGHTIGGISLHDSANKLLISGDTVFAGGVGRWDLPTGDREQLIASVRSLHALKPLDLYPGHGPCALGDAGDRIEEALRILEVY